MKEKIRKGRKNMQGLDYEQVKNPEFFAENGVEAHSDHRYYASREDAHIQLGGKISSGVFNYKKSATGSVIFIKGNLKNLYILTKNCNKRL